MENILFYFSKTHQTHLGCRGEIDGTQGQYWLICHVFKKYVSPTIIISYNGFDHRCALRCIYKYV